MKISNLRIRNFRSIRDLRLDEVDYACILVGKNNTGKTVVLDDEQFLFWLPHALRTILPCSCPFPEHVL